MTFPAPEGNGERPAPASGPDVLCDLGWFLLLSGLPSPSAHAPEAPGGPSRHPRAPRVPSPPEHPVLSGTPPSSPRAALEKTAGRVGALGDHWGGDARLGGGPWGCTPPRGLWSMSDTPSWVPTCCCFPSPSLSPLLRGHGTQTSASHGNTFPWPQGLAEKWAPDPARANGKRGAPVGLGQGCWALFSAPIPAPLRARAKRPPLTSRTRAQQALCLAAGVRHLRLHRGDAIGSIISLNPRHHFAGKG